MSENEKLEKRIQRIENHLFNDKLEKRISLLENEVKHLKAFIQYKTMNKKK